MKQSSKKNSEWSVVRMLEWATDYFSKLGIPSPRLSIEWLLSHILQVKRLDLYLQFDRPLSRDELDRLKPLLKRRALKEPLQYITGSTDFYNLTINVNRDVLIPRPETEQMVDLILQEHSHDKEINVLDVGTGSGCIALAIKKARPRWNVTAIDNCPKALLTAQDNAKTHALDITFHQCDLKEFRSDTGMDMIVSNPPYIEKHEVPELSDQVIAFEPRNALIAEDVADVYRHLLELCRRSLKQGGSFYFEINESIGDKLLLICNIPPFNSRLVQDDQSRDRFILGKF